MSPGWARWALAAVALMGCRAPAPSGATADRPAAGVPRVVLESPSGRSSTVRVEVMRTDAELQRGLMFREHLGPDEGMLFVFAASEDHAFWMKNTLIPLDMIFIDAGRTVVGVVENAEPRTTSPRSVGTSSRYVLEVNGGFCAARGVRAGDRVRFEDVAGVEP